MYLADKECVVFDIPDTTKNDVIKTLISKLDKAGCISNVEQFYENVLNRERICATSIGNEMGLPHGKTTDVLRPSICFGRLCNPVIWNEKTGEKGASDADGGAACRCRVHDNGGLYGQR